ncbi:MAG TPA: SRPBCC family protein [Candidatus Angelobacter sp.]|nr:SRPBCC family protein [Candidatus Angelobacter sp.]
MLNPLLIAALVIAVVVICVLTLAATKPARFALQRSITIQAAPDKIFALINDLHRWPEWSEQGDSRVRRAYSGTPSGKGAVCEWEGTGSAGKGRIEIIESSPNMIRLQADWARPFAARNFNIFTLEPQGNATRITWVLDGENVFMLKLMTIFVSADRLMGKHVEKGLADLKAFAEK